MNEFNAGNLKMLMSKTENDKRDYASNGQIWTLIIKKNLKVDAGWKLQAIDAVSHSG